MNKWMLPIVVAIALFATGVAAAEQKSAPVPVWEVSMYFPFHPDYTTLDVVEVVGQISIVKNDGNKIVVSYDEPTLTITVDRLGKAAGSEKGKSKLRELISTEPTVFPRNVIVDMDDWGHFDSPDMPSMKRMVIMALTRGKVYARVGYNAKTNHALYLQWACRK